MSVIAARPLPDKQAELSLPSALKLLFSKVSQRRRRALLPLLGLMLAGAIAEVVTIGALLPFLAIIADPDGSPVLVTIAPALEWLGADDSQSAVYLLTASFALAALVAGALRLLLLWASNHFIFGLSYEIAVLLYRNVLQEPYLFHIQRNSSEIVAAINKVQIVTNQVLTPLMSGIVALFLSAFIAAGLVVIDPVVALFAGCGFAIIYLGATTLTRIRLRRNSSIISTAQGRRVQAMQEGLGGIRDILIDQSQPVFLEGYRQAEASFRDARIVNSFLAGSPRYLVEAAGMILIALVAVAITGRPGGLIEAIPVLGALALGAQRLLPLIQQIYLGWAAALGNRQVLLDVVELLDRAPPETTEEPMPLPFREQIRLENISFSYGQARRPALHDFSLTIPKGARIGIAGRTGSGKSTLMDIILGLLEPGTGRMLVDGARITAANRTAWQANIAHVPQTIYLADASVAANIAFGIRPDRVDRERVHRAAEQAELTEVIASLPQGYDTPIGERGIQLSGGQRQRIGIARALYKQASVLVFDEATSALDTETESAVMAAIGKLDRDLTILIIAHRLTTLEGCDRIIKLDGGRKLEDATPAADF